jgi:hypothetical protein
LHSGILDGEGEVRGPTKREFKQSQEWAEYQDERHSVADQQKVGHPPDSPEKRNGGRTPGSVMEPPGVTDLRLQGECGSAIEKTIADLVKQRAALARDLESQRVPAGATIPSEGTAEGATAHIPLPGTGSQRSTKRPIRKAFT